VAHDVRHDHIRPQLCLDHVECLCASGVSGAEAKRDEFGLTSDDAFGNKEPRYQVKIVPWGPHGDREGLAVDADFQWLLGGQYVFREPYWLFGA